MSYKSGNDDLLGKKFDVLDKGFVQLVDYMGNDKKVVDAARVSYGKGTKTKHEDEGLIRYLMRHRHTTPFEQCSISLRIKVPMDCWRQWIRHRTASVNEYSTRYSEAIEDKQTTKPEEWRTQGIINKQGSDDTLPHLTGVALSFQEHYIQDLSQNIYKQRLEKGVAREQARKDLPLSTYTLAVWTINLHNLLHFLSLRMDSHAQLEIREYATTIGYGIVSKLFPLTWGAFEDYRLNALTLTARDIDMIKKLQEITRDDYDAFDYDDLFGNPYGWFNTREDGTFKDNIERLEFEVKARRLGIEIPWK